MRSPSSNAFADVSLVSLEQRKRIDKVATIDVSDFAVYRSYAGKRFKNVFDSQ